MHTYKEEDFDPIRPFYENEVHAAVKRILASPVLDQVLNFISTNPPFQKKIRNILKQTYTTFDFQENLMYPLVKHIIDQTSEGFQYQGIDKLATNTPYLFLSNHRDIVLDSAILQIMLHKNGHKTSEITFGSNLMTDPFTIDFGKLNRMFVVNRKGNGKEFFKNAQLLSAYIRHTILNKKTSVWIAQRNGRTKDGNDKTEPGLLKMFNYSGTHTFKESFQELNIIPVVVSYEFEPCCAMKVKEIDITSQGLTYYKSPNEDQNSIISGITQPKGRIHLSIGQPVNSFLDETDAMKTYNQKINKLAGLIDLEIYRNFKLWPNNYIAYDMLHNTSKFTEFYTKNDQEIFTDHMQQELQNLAIDDKRKRELFLKIYTNPLLNKLSDKKSSDC